MSNMQVSQPKSLASLTVEWDRLAEERDRQLAAGIDLSFTHVVAPAALRLLDGADLSFLLDIGSGTGHFAALASAHATSIVGIEPSGASVRIANRICADIPNVRFAQTSIEEASPIVGGRVATAAIALMVLMAAPNLESFATSLRPLLATGAPFVAILPHPCFWPAYWEYANAEWFDYTKEIFIEAPFAISNAHSRIRTTHIHRPLSQYLSTFAKHGFRLDVFDEPMPEPTVQAMYPSPWLFPRFAAIRWIKEA